MVQLFDIPIMDVSADALGLHLDGPAPQQVLMETELFDAPTATSLRLCIIGASHVIELRAGHEVVFREEVSCATQSHGGISLAEVVDTQAAYPQYRFQTEQLRYATVEFDAAATSLCAEFTDAWLVGRFPGEGEHHITALFGQYAAGSWSWDTYHVYPHESTIVHTTSVFKLGTKRKDIGHYE
ncbi:MAG: DUF2617 family protein [Corynebacterium sp.]|nr:DUF2617 family protein [Corynebacterium sp.]